MDIKSVQNTITAIRLMLDNLESSIKDQTPVAHNNINRPTTNYEPKAPLELDLNAFKEAIKEIDNKKDEPPVDLNINFKGRTKGYTINRGPVQNKHKDNVIMLNWLIKYMYDNPDQFPMTRVNILHVLNSHGFYIYGKTPVNILSALLSDSPHFKPTNKGWTLSNPIEE